MEKNETNTDEHKVTEENSSKENVYPKLQLDKNTWSRWLFLGLISVVLCTLGPLSMLAPLPLVMAFLLYDRAKGYSLAALCLVFVLFLIFYLKLPVTIIGVYIFNFVYAALISEMFFRKEHPIRGFLKIGFTLVIIIGSLVGLTLIVGDFSLEQYLHTSITEKVEIMKEANSEMFKTGGPDVRKFEDFIAGIDQSIKVFIRLAPSIIFAMVFFTTWLNIFLLLRSSIIWKRIVGYEYNLRDYIFFKVRDYLIWPLIASLTLVIGGEYILGAELVFVGWNVLICLGTFYFLQGFGIFWEALNFMKIFGFFRSFIIFIGFIVLTKFFVTMIAALGVFDLWFNFRKYFKKQELDK